MNADEVKTGADFEEYLKQHGLVTSVTAEKHLECVRRCQETIRNIFNMSGENRKYYENLGIDLNKELKVWEMLKKAYIKLALTQCESENNIYNLEGWKSATRAYKKDLIQYDLCPIKVEYSEVPKR